MRKYFIGAIIGSALTIGITAHAEVSDMIGKVVDGVFPVTVDGELLANEAIVIQGTSYLPVREFSETLGYEVSFDMIEGIGLNAAEQELEAQEPIFPESAEYKTETPRYIDHNGNEYIPRLESYNSQIRDLELFLAGEEAFGNLGEEAAEEFRQEKARLEAERAQHYPDWDK